MDATSLIVSRTIECTVTNDDADEGSIEGTARLLLRWNVAKKKFTIVRELKPGEQPD